MIRLEKAVIHSYKCMEKAQSFTVGDGITTLMGRNEAGKTSVLEALAKANYFDAQDPRFHYHTVADYPRCRMRDIEKEKAAPLAVTLTYHLDCKLAEQIAEDILLPAKGCHFSRTTDYAGRHRVLENDFEYSLISFLEAYAEKKDKNIRKFIKQLCNVNDDRKFRQFLSCLEGEVSAEEKASVEKLAPYFENKHGWQNPINEYVYRKYLLPNTPRFLYYDEYFMLPSRVSIEKLADGKNLTDSERTAKALLLLAEIDLNKVLESRDFECYKAELEIVQSEFTKEFLKYWTNNSNLRIEFEIFQEEREQQLPLKRSPFLWGKKMTQEKREETFLEIRIKNQKSGISLPLENRSRGFNWFFSFWVWFKALQKENIYPFVILLDEPGLNLHGAAQKDLMRLMKDIARQDQIIFTTHSPYMLEEVKDGIYCVVDREGGTTIRPLVEETDEETLMPLRYMLKSDCNKNEKAEK